MGSHAVQRSLVLLMHHVTMVSIIKKAQYDCKACRHTFMWQYYYFFMFNSHLSSEVIYIKASVKIFSLQVSSGLMCGRRFWPIIGAVWVAHSVLDTFVCITFYIKVLQLPISTQCNTRTHWNNLNELWSMNDRWISECLTLSLIYFGPLSIFWLCITSLKCSHSVDAKWKVLMSDLTLKNTFSYHLMLFCLLMHSLFCSLILPFRLLLWSGLLW